MYDKKIKIIISDSIQKFSQIEELIKMIDNMFSNNSDKPYSMLDVILKDKVSPLHAFVHNQKYYDLKNLYPNILWSSIFLTSYSIFEYCLSSICKSLPDEYSSLYNDLKHKGINKSKVFFKKVCKIKFPDNIKEWDFIKNSNAVRNCIIHRSHNINSYKEGHKIFKFIKECNSLKTVDDKIILGREFPIKFINDSKKIINRITKEIQNKFKKKSLIIKIIQKLKNK